MSTIGFSAENNLKRLIAAEVIHGLWQSGDIAQLNLLRMQIKASLEQPFERKTAVKKGKKKPKGPMKPKPY